MHLFRRLAGALVTVLGLAVMPVALAQSPDAKPPSADDIHLVWMGGNDCPPCMAWRQSELPKLETSPVFRSVRFSYVNKVIRSSVPPRYFLPEDVKPFKDQLDAASGGIAGSPQGVLLVKGQVFDYFHGTRTATEIETMIVAVRSGTEYPFKRCTKIAAWHKCDLTSQ